MASRVPGAPAPAPAPAVPREVREEVAKPAKAPESPRETSGSVSEQDALAKVTAIIAQRTGYPPDVLDPNLDMEADLGIDTVKQAEIFGEVREAFGIPRV